MSKVNSNYESGEINEATPEEVREEIIFNEDDILRALTDQKHYEDH